MISNTTFLLQSFLCKKLFMFTQKIHITQFLGIFKPFFVFVFMLYSHASVLEINTYKRVFYHWRTIHFNIYFVKLNSCFWSKSLSLPLMYVFYAIYNIIFLHWEMIYVSTIDMLWWEIKVKCIKYIKFC